VVAGDKVTRRGLIRKERVGSNGRDHLLHYHSSGRPPSATAGVHWQAVARAAPISAYPVPPLRRIACWEGAEIGKTPMQSMQAIRSIAKSVWTRSTWEKLATVLAVISLIDLSSQLVKWPH
jgi:hypothetical protein